jgi:hypothetical protein
MTSSPYASEAKVTEALNAIGAELVGQTEQQLLQQILVAAATASGGGTPTAPTFASITGSPTDNTNLATALNAKLSLTGGTLSGALTINAASGPFLDIKQSGADVFKVSYAASGTCIDCVPSSGGQALMSSGGIYIGRRDTSNPATAAGYEAWIGNYNGNGINIRGTAFYGFGADNGNNLHSIRNAAFYYGGASNTIQMGATSATPSTQTFLGSSGLGTNIAGGKMRVAAGRSTGNATPAVLALQGTAAGSSGTTAQTLVDVLSIIRAGVIRITDIPTSAAGLSTGDVWSNGGVLTIV